MGRINEQYSHRVRCEDEDDPDPHAWATMIAEEWSAELGDSAQDIYTLDDGEPVEELR